MNRLSLVKLVLLSVVSITLASCSNVKDTAEPPVELMPIEVGVLIDPIWQHSLGGKQGRALSELTPLVREERLYAAVAEGDVFAFDAKTGKELWNVDTDKRISAGVSGNDSAVFFGGQNGEIVALNIENGQPIWQKQLNSETVVPPAVNNDYVIVLGGNGTVFCLSASNGELVWSKKLNMPKLSLKGNAKPHLIGDVVYLGLDNGQVMALFLENGRSLWRSTIGLQRGKTELDRLADVDMLTVDLRGALFASAYNGSTVLINPANGQLGWGREIPSATTAQIDADSLYLVDDISKVWKLDKRTGKTRWLSNKLRARALSGVAPVNNGVALVSDFEGYVHALDVDTGSIIGRNQLFESPLSGDIQWSGGVFYALSINGKLVAFRVNRVSTQ